VSGEEPLSPAARIHAPLSLCFFFFSSRRRHTRFSRDWSSDVCSSDLMAGNPAVLLVTSQLRAAMAQFIRNSIEQLHVLAYQEVPDNKSITIVASIGGK